MFVHTVLRSGNFESLKSLSCTSATVIILFWIVLASRIPMAHKTLVTHELYNTDTPKLTYMTVLSQLPRMSFMCNSKKETLQFIMGTSFLMCTWMEERTFICRYIQYTSCLILARNWEWTWSSVQTSLKISRLLFCSSCNQALDQWPPASTTHWIWVTAAAAAGAACSRKL